MQYQESALELSCNETKGGAGMGAKRQSGMTRREEGGKGRPVSRRERQEEHKWRERGCCVSLRSVDGITMVCTGWDSWCGELDLG